jgi:hypothetical protein
MRWARIKGWLFIIINVYGEAISLPDNSVGSRSGLNLRLWMTKVRR